jgi:DNA-binding NarL/FixJ family response regulator
MKPKRKIPPDYRARKKSRLLVVDDHPTLREGIVRVIEHTTDLAVINQAANIAQALETIGRSMPDLVILDISLANESGLELIKILAASHPRLPILVHSMYDESAYAERCIRAGARGYVMKMEAPQTLINAVRQVLKGEVFLSPAVTKQILNLIGENSLRRGNHPAKRFTDREVQVLELIGQGLPTSQIAKSLKLSENTIQTYREHLKRKLGVKDSSSLIRRAVQWVESDK